MTVDSWRYTGKRKLSETLRSTSLSAGGHMCRDGTRNLIQLCGVESRRVKATRDTLEIIGRFEQ